MRTKRSVQVGVLTALVVTLALAGCASSTKSGPSGGGSVSGVTTSAAPVASGTPADSSKSTINIGILVTLTGTNSSDQGQPVLNVAEAWVDWVNKTQGGVDGHPVKLFSENTQATPAAAAAAASKLVQDDVVAAIGNADGQDEAIYTKPLVDAKIPVIGGAIIADQVLTSSPYIYGFSAGAVPGLKLQADVAKLEGAKNMGTILCNSAPTCSGASDVVGGEAKKIGLTYSGYVGVADGAPNYDAACLTLKQKGVDYVFLGIAAENVPRIVTDCAQQGYKPQYGDSFSSAEGAILNPLATQFGVSFSGVLPSFQWFGTSAPIKMYQQVMTQFSPSHSVFANQAPTAAWTAFELFRKAMSQDTSSPASFTSADVQTAMEGLQNEDLGGLLPQKLSWAPGQNSVDPTCAWNYKDTKGVFTGDANPVCLAPGA